MGPFTGYGEIFLRKKKKKRNLDQGGISGTILAGSYALNVLIWKRPCQKNSEINPHVVCPKNISPTCDLKLDILPT